MRRPAAAVAAVTRVPRPAATAAGLPVITVYGSQPSGRQARSVRCFAASTEQGRERGTGSRAAGSHWAGSSGDEDGWRGSTSGPSSADPLLRSITQCSTSRELHQLLLRHSGDLGGREVAAAIEVTARRRLLEPTPSAGGGSTGPLAPLLVQLADKYAPVMEPGSLSAAAWGLAALQLVPARPVVRQMQDLARRQLFRFAPSQLCTLLWAGSSLDPGGHSPLLPALAALIRGGMSLALFSSHNLAVLAYLCGQASQGGAGLSGVSHGLLSTAFPRTEFIFWLMPSWQTRGMCLLRLFQLSQLPPSTPSACLRGCLQEGGRAATSSPAKDICIAVTDECRSRLQEYQQAERQAQAYQRAEQRARDEAAGLQRKRKPRAKSTEILPGLPPPPFTPGDAAMLLTGLAQLGLRVGGVVEPLVRQCKARLETAPANDVTRILVALGDLSMEIRECWRLGRLSMHAPVTHLPGWRQTVGPPMLSFPGTPGWR